jgi:hypothetical protein
VTDFTLTFLSKSAQTGNTSAHRFDERLQALGDEEPESAKTRSNDQSGRTSGSRHSAAVK